MTSKVRRWTMELDSYDETAKRWTEDAKRITRRYALEQRQDTDQTVSAGKERFNILWANVQTIQPALFASVPVPVVQRRHRDPDKVGRMAAQILERALITEMENDGWLDVFDQLTLDVLLVARGVPWVRYDPDIREVKGEGDEAARETLAGERCPIDYIHWSDFAHAPLKTWPEVMKNGWVARRVRMTRAQLRSRFGKEKADKVPLSFKPPGIDEAVAERMKPVMGRADIWEVWDAVDSKVIWLCREYTDMVLDERDDPLSLDGFYPCPMPAFGSRSNETLVPIPDYLQYEPLAEELDEITMQISNLVPAVRAAGVYDSRYPGLGRLFTDAAGKNQMIPVEGGLDPTGNRSLLAGAMDMLPLDTIAGALISLYDARDRLSNLIYEISGVSDIIRGQVDPREKLGQSQLKGRFASQRLDKRRRAVELAARDTIRIKAEIMAERYDDRTLREMSGFDQLPEVVNIMQAQPQPPQPGMPPPPDPRQIVEDLWTRARALLKDERLRGFRVEIETNSTIVLDQQEEMENRNEFLNATGAYMKQAMEVAQVVPDWTPLMAEILLYVIRGHHVGRTMESAFEEAVENLKRQAEQPQEPQPDPAAEAEARRPKADRATGANQDPADAAGRPDRRAEGPDGPSARAGEDRGRGHQGGRRNPAHRGEAGATMQEMEAKFSATIGELTARVQAAEQTARVKVQSQLATVAAKESGEEKSE